jgi:hypothetical protein
MLPEPSWGFIFCLNFYEHDRGGAWDPRVAGGRGVSIGHIHEGARYNIPSPGLA